MKLKNKIVITGISALSILGASTLAINSFDNSHTEQKQLNKSVKSTSDSLAMTKLTTMEELEAYIPNISTGGNLKIPGMNYLGATVESQPRARFFPEPIEDDTSTTTFKIEMSEDTVGNFKFNLNGNYMRSNQGTRLYANARTNVDGDSVEIWLRGDEIFFIPKVENPSEATLNLYYDVRGTTTPDDLNAGLQVHTEDFPTDDILDAWQFKTKINTQAEIMGEINYPSSDSISFNLLQPQANPTPLEQTISFDVYIDNVMTETISYNNPGTEEEFIINSASIDNSKEQEIKLDFGLYFDQLVFNTAILDHSTSSTLSATKFDDTKITVKINDFINGDGWKAAEEFQFIINGEDALPSNIFDISLIQDGTYEGFADVTGYDQTQPITVKVRYLDDSGLESFSNEVVVVTAFNPGEITTKNITQKTATVSFENITQGTGSQLVETFEVQGTSTSSADNPEGTTKVISVANQQMGDIREVNLTDLLTESSNTVDIIFKNNVDAVVATETITFNTPAFTEVQASTTGLEATYDTSVFNGVNLKWNYTQGIDKWGGVTEPEPVVVTLTFHNMTTGSRVNTGTFTFTADPQGGAYAINFDDMIAAGQITQENVDGGFSVKSDTTTGLPENGFEIRTGSSKMPGWVLALIITFSILGGLALAWLIVWFFRRWKSGKDKVSDKKQVKGKPLANALSPTRETNLALKEGTITSDFRTIYSSSVINKVNVIWKYHGSNKKDDLEEVIINVAFHNMPKKSNGNVFEFKVDAKKQAYLLDFDKMISEEKIIQANINGGFTISSPTTTKLSMSQKVN